MLGRKTTIKRGGRDEGERPFWISFADMMTAMMVLFLLVMSVALLSVTKPHDDRSDGIATLCRDVQIAARGYAGIHVDCERNVIDFGDRARFDVDRYDLKPDQQRLLRSFVPEILRIAGNPLGQKWLKRIVVEGYTDKSGSYLHNLNLSLQRSQQVLCALLADPEFGEQGLRPYQKRSIQKLFLVGGYSANSAKVSKDASRRIELRLEFYGSDEAKSTHSVGFAGDIGRCSL